VLRSLVWRLTGSLQRATAIAASVGRIAAWGFLAFGVLRIIAGDVIGGLWIAVLGWFLHNAASLSEAQTEVELRLRGISVRDVTADELVSVPPDLSVDQLIEDYLLAHNRRSVVVAREGRRAGIVSVSDIRGVPAADRASTRVGDVMSGADEIASVAPDDDLKRALEVLSEGDFEQVPVVDRAGHLVSCLSRADVLRQVELRRMLDVEPASEPGASTNPAS
jgi:CBS domain-containing protein